MIKIGDDLTKRRAKTTSNWSETPDFNFRFPMFWFKMSVCLIPIEVTPTPCFCGENGDVQSNLFIDIFTRPSSSGGNRVWNLTDVPSL